MIILELSLAATCALGAPAAVTIGDTTLPHGMDAFPDTVECLNLDDGCGGGISPLTGPPNYQFIGSYTGILGTRLLESILCEVRQSGELRMTFDVPVVNRPGPDIYIAQAHFVAGELTQFDSYGINDVDLALDATTTWTTVPATAFAADSSLGILPFWYIEDEIRNAYYELHYATVDLDTLGVAANASINTLLVRGPDLPEWPETIGLDIVTIANLNPIDCPDITGDGAVNFDDLNAILNAWATSDPTLDIDSSGLVDFGDLNAVLGQWSAMCD